MTRVPEKSLEIPGDTNPLIDCNSLTELSLKTFQETLVRNDENETGPL